MRLLERLAGNTYFLLLDWLAVTVLSFIFWVVIWKSLPPESTGIIATSLHLIILISTFGVFGMHATLTKLISEYARKNREGRIRSLIKFSNKILIGINLVVAAAFFTIVTYSGIDLKIPPLAVAAVSVGIFIWPLAISTTSILQGFQNMRRIYRTDFVSNIFKVAVAAATIFVGLEFFGPIVALLVSFAVLIVLRRDVLQFGKSVKERIDKHHVLVKYALPALVTSVSWALFINTPVIILTLFDSLRSSGLFAAAVSIANQLAYIPSIVATALFPITSSLMVAKHHAKQQAKLINSAVRYVLFISLPMLIVYIFFAKAFILVFAQLEYLEAVPLIPIVGTAILIQAVGYIFLSSLFAIRKTEANRNVAVATAATFLLLAIPMTINFGIMGLVAAFVVSVLVFASLSYAILKKNLKFKLPYKAIGKIALASFVLFIILFFPEILGFELLVKFPFLIAGLFLYFWVLGRTKFYTEEDLTVLNFAKRRLPSLRGVIARIEKFIKGNISD